MLLLHSFTFYFYGLVRLVNSSRLFTRTLNAKWPGEAWTMHISVDHKQTLGAKGPGEACFGAGVACT